MRVRVREVSADAAYENHRKWDDTRFVKSAICNYSLDGLSEKLRAQFLHEREVPLSIDMFILVYC